MPSTDAVAIRPAKAIIRTRVTFCRPFSVGEKAPVNFKGPRQRITPHVCGYRGQKVFQLAPKAKKSRQSSTTPTPERPIWNTVAAVPVTRRSHA
jgi:hypothetical protein